MQGRQCSTVSACMHAVSGCIYTYTDMCCSGSVAYDTCTLTADIHPAAAEGTVHAITDSDKAELIIMDKAED